MTINNAILSVLAFAILLLASVVMFKPLYQSFAEGWTPVHIQSATSTSVGIYAPVTLFADESSPTCHNRVVSTNHDIRLSFDQVTGHGSSTLSATVGHIQLASTSVSYDSALFGCGQMTARAITATTTVTISSF